MKSVHKFQLYAGEIHSILMPDGAEILRVGPDGMGNFSLWCLVDEKAPMRNRTIFVFSTGAPIYDDRVGEYIGSFEVNNNDPYAMWMIFHVFDGGWQ
jgi:hypothetical protein